MESVFVILTGVLTGLFIAWSKVTTVHVASTSCALTECVILFMQSR